MAETPQGEGLDNPTWESDNAPIEGHHVISGQHRISAGNERRRNSELYQELANKPDLASRLRFASNKMSEISLALIQVLEEIDNVEMTGKKVQNLEMLPTVVRELSDFFARQDGPGESWDKAYQYISDVMLEKNSDLEPESFEEMAPFLSLGNTEPLPEDLPEELKTILRQHRTAAGYDDNGNKIGA